MKIFLTKEGLGKLQQSLLSEKETLKIIREEKAKSWQGDGDGTHDNPVYQKLKDDEGIILQKIAQLEEKLSSATIVDPTKKKKGEIVIGAQVRCLLEYLSTGKIVHKEFQIVGYNETDAKKNKVAYNSPIGNALMNMKIGETKNIQLPSTEKIKITINSID